MTGTSRPAGVSQRRIALAAQLRPRDPGSNFAFLWHMPAGLDATRLAAAAERAFGAQHGLRERFEFTSRGDIVAVPVHARVDCPTRRYDGLRQLQEHVGVLGDTARVITRWPLFHIEVALVGDDIYFVFAGSHLVGDATMLYHLLGDLDDRYADLDMAPDCVGSPSEADHGADQSSMAGEYFDGLLDGFDTLAISGWVRRDRAGRIPGRITRHAAHPDGYRAAKGLAGRLTVRRYSVLLTTFGLLVTALAGESRVVISNPVSGRHAGGAAARVRGLLTNALPVVIDTERHTTFAALACDVDQQVSALIALENCSFADVARRLLPANDVEAALPSASFTVYPRPLAPALGGQPALPVEVPRRYLQYPLTVNVEVRDGQATLLVECADELSVGDVDVTFWHILDQAVRDPHTQLREFSWCPDIVDGSLLPALRRPRAETLIQRFDAVVARTPHAPAIECAGTAIDYRELSQAADIVAAHVAGLPAGMIGVAMEPGVELVATVLGVLRAGRTYVPIRPDTPRARVESIVTACRGLLIAGTFDDAWSDIPGATPVTLGTIVAPDHGPNTATPAKPSDTAYVLFTSGTTGRPKGVQISHASVTGMLDSVAEDMSLTGRRWSWYHSFAFDASVWEMFGALLFGGVLCIPCAQAGADPADMAAFVDAAGIQILSQTPSAFEVIGPRLATLPVCDLESVVFFGERLDSTALAPFADAHPGVALINMYGITEITVHATFYRFPADRSGWRPESVIGRPLRHTSMAVVDPLHRILPRGARGELAVGGTGVMTGYLGQPALTAQRIVEIAGIPMYLSGDRGYLNAAGDLVYLDRIDNQVQVRGHRIELGEVEHAIRSAGITDAVCVLPHGDGISRQLIGFVVPRDNGSVETLRDHVRGLLPEYMVPAHVVALPVLPLSVNGKVDRRALVQLLESSTDLLIEPAGISQATARQSPSVQAAIIQIWTDVLGHGEFGPDTRFFEAGGTSAGLVAVSQLLHARLRVDELDITDLFEHCTPAALAGHLTRGAQDAPKDIGGPGHD